MRSLRAIRTDALAHLGLGGLCTVPRSSQLIHAPCANHELVPRGSPRLTQPAHYGSRVRGDRYRMLAPRTRPRRMRESAHVVSVACGHHTAGPRCTRGTCATIHARSIAHGHMMHARASFGLRPTVDSSYSSHALLASEVCWHACSTHACMQQQ